LDDDVDGPVGGEVGEVRGELPGLGEERDDGGESEERDDDGPGIEATWSGVLDAWKDGGDAVPLDGEVRASTDDARL
jgi:hypothetical protein